MVKHGAMDDLFVCFCNVGNVYCFAFLRRMALIHIRITIHLIHYHQPTGNIILQNRRY